MSSLLRLSRLIDWINERVGRSVMWLVLIAVVISAGNALVRKLFNTSSNALLEIQWYLFAAIFMLAAGYTFLRNEHVRIRSELGLLTTPEDVELANAARERAAWAAILRSHGWLAHDVDIDTEPGLEELVVALHRAVAGSPARLIGVSLPDVAGDRRAQNQPGTDQEYPNWRIPMTDELGRPVLLEALMDRPELLTRIVGTIGRVAP